MQKRFLSIVVVMLACLTAQAQRTVIGGVVSNAQTGQRLAQVSVAVEGGGESVVTNEDGQFSLKSDREVQRIVVSHVGFQTQRVSVAQRAGEQLDIRLQPATIELREVVVWTGDPRELVGIAIRKIPENYARQPELMDCFYRETVMKRQHYISVAEGVVDMYKTAYDRSTARDRVAIRKGRRLLSPRSSDTLSVKVVGGPVQPIQLDVVKNLDFLFNDEELANYEFTMQPPEVIDDRQQFVVAITPLLSQPYALYFGKFYIDRETLAFRRIELQLDVRDRDKATRYMLMRKPLGVRFRPRELSCLIDYRTDDGVTRISYIRNAFRFNCDWRRRLFATSFTATCELVVTDRRTVSTSDRPLSGRESFDSRDAFFDKVDYFRDPSFWSDYNIIEPSESLDRAINRILKRYE